MCFNKDNYLLIRTLIQIFRFCGLELGEKLLLNIILRGNVLENAFQRKLLGAKQSFHVLCIMKCELKLIRFEKCRRLMDLMITKLCSDLVMHVEYIGLV